MKIKQFLIFITIFVLLLAGCGKRGQQLSKSDSSTIKEEPVKSEKSETKKDDKKGSSSFVAKSDKSKKKEDKKKKKKPKPSEEVLVTTGELSLVTEERYDSVYLSISPEEFEKLGFRLGDGVDVLFSNGVTYENIPYYSGDYCRINEYFVYANIYDDTVEICCNYNPDFFWEDEITDETTVVITMHESGRYKDIEDRLNISYSNDPQDYPDMSVFANFRELSGGNIAPGRFYRGASPCNNHRNRAADVNGMMRSCNIAYVLDLADSRGTFEDYREEYGEEYTYDWDLFLNDKISFVDMNFEFSNDEYKEWIADGLKDMLKNDGPYFIHCNEGMDRTGFVCAILEGLAGATYEEMRDDYMLSYKNYYGIDDESDPETYDLIVETYFDSFMILLHGEEDHRTLKNADYQEDIEDYLVDGGMTEKEVKKLKKLLSGGNLDN